MSHPPVYEFGAFRLLPAARLLLRDGQAVPITSKVFDLLLALVTSNGALLERQRLMNELWPGVIVEEGNLTQSIFLLRKALGEQHNGERFILTVPGRGYRFVAPVRKVRASGEANGTSRASDEQLATPGQRSIAVLPLKPLGLSRDYEYLGTGIADSLITTLSSHHHLIVRPTTAVLKFAEIGNDPMAAGRELNTEVVLDGTVQQSGERIRVSVQLINVSSGTTLWAGRFDDALTDFFAVQDSIAEQIARRLRLEIIHPAPREHSRHTDNLAAWQLYLQSRYFQDKRTEAGLRKSIEYAQQVITLAPQSAMGYVCLADAYNLLGEYLYLNPNEAFPAARTAVQQALEFDHALAEAHASLAETLMFYDRDWSQAEREYQTAIALNPNYAAAYHWYAWLLMLLGRTDEAIDQLHTAQRIDPGSLYIKTALGLPYYYSRRYDQAIAHHRQTLEMDAAHSGAHYYLGEALVQTGQYAEAITEFEQVTSSHAQQAAALRAHALALDGQTGEARTILNQLLAQARQQYVSPYCLALLHAGFGEADAAFAYLEKSLSERAAWLIFMKADPFLDRLRDDARFADLLQRAGFPA